MATEKVIRAWQKQQPKPKKCEKDGTCWGVQKYENCGGSWTWGD